MMPNGVEAKRKPSQEPAVLCEKEKPHLGPKDDGEHRKA